MSANGAGRYGYHRDRRFPGLELDAVTVAVMAEVIVAVTGTITGSVTVTVVVIVAVTGTVTGSVAVMFEAIFVVIVAVTGTVTGSVAVMSEVIVAVMMVVIVAVKTEEIVAVSVAVTVAAVPVVEDSYSPSMSRGYLGPPPAHAPVSKRSPFYVSTTLVTNP